jgi:hypothetical protein
VFQATAVTSLYHILKTVQLGGIQNFRNENLLYLSRSGPDLLLTASQLTQPLVLRGRAVVLGSYHPPPTGWALLILIKLCMFAYARLRHFAPPSRRQLMSFGWRYLIHRRPGCDWLKCDTGAILMPGFDAFILLLRVLLCLVLTFLPSFAVCTFAIRKGTRNAMWLNFLALAQIGAVGYLSFWLWFASPIVGRIFSFCLPVASLACLVHFFRSSDADSRNALKSLVFPTALTATSALIVLSAGFLYGGIKTPLQTATIRFSHLLPADNQLPYYLAKLMSHGRPPTPFFGDWLSSDRPPLQTGICLSQFAYCKGEITYEILSVVLQSLWIYALFLLLSSLRLDLRAVRLTLLTSLFSGFVFINSFYVWPKLLAAAFMLAFSALLLSPDLLRDITSRPAKAVLGGALLAFALLAHGGAVFSVIGLGITVLFIHPRVLFRKGAWVTVLACVCLYLPWTLYQKLYDPPGDRLLKWHLAGVTRVNSVPFGKALVAAYSNLSFQQVIDYRLQNLDTVANGKGAYWTGLQTIVTHIGKHSPEDVRLVQQTAQGLRALCFFQTAPCLGFLMFGPIALFVGISRRLRSEEWKAASLLYLYVGLSLLVWCLLLFGPATAIIHQGSYAVILLSFTAAILAFWTISPWLARAMAFFQILVSVLLYGILMREPLPSDPASQLPVQVGTFALFTVSVILLIVLSSRFRSVTAPEVTYPLNPQAPHAPVEY